MAKEKKINVKVRLNKNLKSQVLDLGLGSMYPVYFEVSYDRNTTRFPSGYWVLESLFDDLQEDDSVIQSLESVKKIVRNEIERTPDFTITGFGSKFKSYCSSLWYGMRLGVVNQMQNVMGELLTHNKYQEWNKLSLKDKFMSFTKSVKGTSHEQPFGRLVYLTSIVEDCVGNASIFEWLLSSRRQDFIKRIEDRAEAHQGENALALFENLTIEFDYQPTPSKEIEGIDISSYLLIDQGFNTGVEIDKIVYHPGEGILNVKIGS